jgi:hypothetical protein
MGMVGDIKLGMAAIHRDFKKEREHVDYDDHQVKTKTSIVHIRTKQNTITRKGAP